MKREREKSNKLCIPYRREREVSVKDWVFAEHSRLKLISVTKQCLFMLV